MSAQALELTARGKGRSGSSWIIGKLIAKQSSENIQETFIQAQYSDSDSRL